MGTPEARLTLTTAEFHDLEYAKHVLFMESNRRGNPIELEDAYSILDALLKHAKVVKHIPGGETIHYDRTEGGALRIRRE
jgi:hypothetical protein